MLLTLILITWAAFLLVVLGACRVSAEGDEDARAALSGELGRAGRPAIVAYRQRSHVEARRVAFHAESGVTARRKRAQAR